MTKKLTLFGEQLIPSDSPRLLFKPTPENRPTGTYLRFSKDLTGL
jgi:hypothetical protein